MQRMILSNDLKVRVWYMAICGECSRALAQPFSNEEDRSAWVQAHETVPDHRVQLRTEIVISPKGNDS